MSTTNAPGGKDYLTDTLPQELLDQIIGNLDVGNQLKLRLVFSRDVFKDRVVEATRPSLSTLFVSPSKVSLRNFKRIAESPFFHDYVDTVIFVGNATDEEPSFVDLSEEENSAVAGNGSTQVERYLDAEVTPFEKYRRELFFDGKLTAQQAAHSFAIYQAKLADHKAVPSHVLLNTLKDGLRTLPKLKHMVIADFITKDGLNADASQYSCGYKMDRAARGLDNVSRVLNTIHLRLREKGADALFDALKDANIELEILSIGEARSYATDIRIQDSTSFSHEALSSVFSKLRRLTVNCDDFGCSMPEDTRDFWEYIVTSAVRLEELILVATHGGWDSNADEDSAQVHRHFFEAGTHPNLKKVHIVGHDAFDAALVNAKELMSFLLRHRKSLREVDLVDVLVSTATPAEDVCRTIEAFLNAAITNLPELVTFKMRIYRRHRRDEHDEDICGWRQDTSECVRGCESYRLYFNSSLHREDLERLADSLHIDLKGDAWDFGQYVMRQFGAAQGGARPRSGSGTNCRAWLSHAVSFAWLM